MKVIKVSFPAIRIERRFADAIFAGRKLWEFRKRPLPLWDTMLLVVGDEGDRVVGAINFTVVVGATSRKILGLISNGLLKPWAKYAGCTQRWLDEYAGTGGVVYASLVGCAGKFDLQHGVYRNRTVSFEFGASEAAEAFGAYVKETVSKSMLDRYELVDPARAASGKEAAR